MLLNRSVFISLIYETNLVLAFVYLTERTHEASQITEWLFIITQSFASPLTISTNSNNKAIRMNTSRPTIGRNSEQKATCWKAVSFCPVPVAERCRLSPPVLSHLWWILSLRSTVASLTAEYVHMSCISLSVIEMNPIASFFHFLRIAWFNFLNPTGFKKERTNQISIKR